MKRVRSSQVSGLLEARGSTTQDWRFGVFEIDAKNLFTGRSDPRFTDLLHRIESR